MSGKVVVLVLFGLGIPLGGFLARPWEPPTDHTVRRALLVFGGALAAAAAGALMRSLSDTMRSVAFDDVAVGLVIVGIGAGWGAMLAGVFTVLRRRSG